MSEHFKGKVAQKALIVKESKVLITRDSRDPDTWELPGGRLDENEEPVEGLKREMKEELGVDVVIQKIQDIVRMYHARDDEWMLAVYYVASLASPDVDLIVDPIEIAEMKWIGKEDYMEYKLFPEYATALANFFKQI